MNGVTIAVKRLPHAAGLPLPSYESEQCAGMDIAAAIAAPVTVAPGERVLVPSGLVIGLPDGYEAQIRPRSGLALKHGITLVNTPGTIDADYRGEIGIILINHGDTPFTVEPGMRIAQMVIAPVTRASWRELDDVPSTARGDGGFGSTGVASRQV